MTLCSAVGGQLFCGHFDVHNNSRGCEPPFPHRKEWSLVVILFTKSVPSHLIKLLRSVLAALLKKHCAWYSAVPLDGISHLQLAP
jgi:hypothetical protein